MFRGEPIALFTIVFGLIFFLLTQIFGILLSGIVSTEFSFVRQSHFYLAYLGWIGFVILGAQLQFFRAITGLRRYEPTSLRYVFLASLLSGMFFLIYGNSYEMIGVIRLGWVLYLTGVAIHSYWIIAQTRSRLFKFPLDYFVGSQIFFGLSMIMISVEIFSPDFAIAFNNTTIIHFLAIGWISMSLQGAMIRILPMFVGQNINRKFRPHLQKLFALSFSSSLVLSFAFYLDIEILYIVGGIFWIVSWAFVVTILFTSIKPNFQNLMYKETLAFFVPGLLYMTVGMVLGFYFVVMETYKYYIIPVHIHMSLLLGLSLIMLGAIHRITTFQIYTILYTGRREGKSLADLMHRNWTKLLALGFNIASPVLVYGFYRENQPDYTFIGHAGIILFILTIVYVILILNNVILYLKDRKNAVPYWLKPTEFDFHDISHRESV